jgi:hypothetical protein
MFKKIFISIIIALLAVTAVFGSVPTFAEESNVIGFTECGFKLPKEGETAPTGSESAISKCVKQIMTFLFVIGIFLMAFRIAYIGINKFNPLEQGGEAQQVGMIRDIAIGLILLGSPALVLGALNEDLLKINFLDFSSFTGGSASLKPVVPVSDVQQIDVATITNGALVETGKLAIPIVTVEDGKVTRIEVDEGGTDYKSAPDVIITPVNGKGSGAKAVASIQAGSVTSVRIIDPGSGYVPDPIIKFVGGNNKVVAREKEKTVLGITPSFLRESFRAQRYASRENNSGDVIKFLRAQKNCEYRVFSFLNITDADCDNFIPTVAKEFQDVLDEYANEVDYIRTNGSKTLESFEGFFTNTEAVFIKATGEGPVISDGYTTGGFDEPAGKTICAINYFTVTIPNYPTKKISTKECGKDNLVKDKANLTNYGTYSYGCGILSSCSGERRLPSPQSQVGITFPIGYFFNRQITILGNI